jgi:hypothetical protein
MLKIKNKTMFKRKVKVTFYLKSGNVFSLKFESFEISKLSGGNGNREMTYKGAEKIFTVDIDNIECVIIN